MAATAPENISFGQLCLDHKLSMTVEGLLEDYLHHLRFTLGRDQYCATERDAYFALALCVRDRLIERWMATQQEHHRKNVKRVYYLSLEFLIGRLLGSNVINFAQMEDLCEEAMARVGIDWHRLRDYEADAGLGNGGLGRLAACFMDSLSTLGLPAIGYGLRYDYGIFTQRIENGYQVEDPDHWLKYGYPWEIGRPDYSANVHFGGHVEPPSHSNGHQWCWVDTRTIVGMPYNLPIVGYGGQAMNTLRLWSARAADEFDFEDFNRGDYVEAVANKVLAENLTKVLYPNDNMFEGRELRLKQQYFLVSCSLQDIVRRFLADDNKWSEFPDKAFIQLNDTHPSLAIPELMRLMMDEHGLGWDEAWEITEASTGYTNHTILPEALERWPVDMMESLLPRHMQIIYEINARFMRRVASFCPFDTDRQARMSIIGEGDCREVRMANLATVGSCSVNGVAQIHTDLLKTTVLKDFAEMWPSKFNNKTNGVTQRRWLRKANPALAALITESIGDGWISDLDQLRGLEPLATDAGFRERFREAKRQNKLALANVIKDELDIDVSPDALFDVQVKRIHEYKRQLLLALYAIVRYNRIKRDPCAAESMVPRVFLFSGKSAPGFFMAKTIIKLIHQIGEVVNNDPQVGDLMKVVFMPNYRVSLAERIIPAANLSEQISLAGTEASGTGNMKLQLNGALTIGTLDGANIEILQEVGDENIFIFGMTAEEVACRRCSYNPWDVYNSDDEIRDAVGLIERDFFTMFEPGVLRPIVQTLLEAGDHYMVLGDLRSFIDTQDQVDALYRCPELWDGKAILNVARGGKFSSDRTIREYASEIWGIEPCEIPDGKLKYLGPEG